MAAKTYTDQQKRDAMEMAEAIGAKGASTRLGIPAKTIRAWCRQHGLKTGPDEGQEKIKAATEAQKVTNESRREDLRGKLLERAHYIADRMVKPHEEWMKGQGGELELVKLRRAPSGAIKDYSISLGILIDKLRLESGEVGSRSEVIGKDQMDVELEKLAREIQQSEKSGAPPREE